MTEELRREIALLQERNAHLVRRATDAEDALEAFGRGEVDAVAIESTPVLLHAAQHQLRDSQRLLRAIIDGALDAIMLTNDDGVYVDANPAAATIFGLPREQLLGRHFGDFFVTSEDHDAVFQAFRERGHWTGVFPIQRGDGTQRILDFSAVADVIPGRHLSILRDITERDAAEDALRRNEALFRAVIEKSSEVISLTSRDGTTRYLTPSAWRVLGWEPEEMRGATFRDQAVPEDRVRIASEIERLIRTGERDMAMEIRVRHRDGSIRWVESTGTNLLDDPNVGAIVGNYRDITARKHADALLRESRNQLEEAQAIAHFGSWRGGLALDDTVAWSAECYRIFGIAEATRITQRLIFESIHVDDRERVRSAMAKLIASDETFDIEHRLQRPDGEVRWVLARAIVDRDGSGAATQLVGTIQDITDRHLVHEALQASEERYRRIVENTSEGVWVFDANGTTTFMNARMAAMLGYSVDEAVGQHVSAFLDEAKPAAANEHTRPIADRPLERTESQLRRKDGTVLWTSQQATPLFDPEAHFDGAIVLVSDVTAARRADETRANLAAIVEASDDAIFGARPDGTITSWNRAAERLYAYTPGDMIGQALFLLVPPAIEEAERRQFELVAAGGPTQTYETERYRKNRTTVEVALTLSAMRDANHEVIGVSSITRDLTARRKAEVDLRGTEDQLRQAQKMEAVGRLAGGVAHDFNNLLSVIVSYSQFAIEDLKVGDPLRDDMLEIDKACQRATDLTKQLLAFSRKQVLQPRILDLNVVVAPMQRMLSRLIGEDVALSLLLTPDIGHVRADGGQLEQVLMNLAVNARDAMPDGGQLTIETRAFTCDSDRVGIPAGNYVMLTVRDTGVGMDAATCARIFEPFFTTKEQGKGTGLGLSTVFGIVKQSDGYVSVESEPTRGTTFKVYLPRTDLPVEGAIHDDQARVLRGSETVLLVEDEEQVRAVAATILRRNGYNVLDTSNGGEAFLVAKSFPERIHLLLTDVVMPRMNGRRLAEELAATRPEMKILYASGYTDDEIIHHGVLDLGVAFLHKPFTPATLLRKVRDILDLPRS